jgi:hypothetical protein
MFGTLVPKMLWSGGLNPFWTIVHLFTAHGHIADARKAMQYMAQSSIIPICIYIKEIRLHNNKREKSGQRFGFDSFS